MRKLPETILAIDQGSSKCGWAYLEDGVVVQSGVFKLKGKDRMLRYKQLLTLLTDMVCDLNIKYMAIEDVFMKRSGFSNPKTSKIMGETRGIIASVGLLYDMDIINVNPAELTKYLGINTRTENKKEVTKTYVAKLVEREVAEDEADAVIIGLITHNRLKHEKS